LDLIEQRKEQIQPNNQSTGKKKNQANIVTITSTEKTSQGK
jgi:hypothetical protein